MQTFIKTLTIGGRPLVLRFEMKDRNHFFVTCLNDKTVEPIELRKEENWTITGGGAEEIRKNEKKLIAVLEENC